jgi:hypothetical protein
VSTVQGQYRRHSTSAIERLLRQVAHDTRARHSNCLQRGCDGLMRKMQRHQALRRQHHCKTAYAKTARHHDLARRSRSEMQP